MDAGTHIIRKGDAIFETGCEVVDVTSNYRPNTGWRFTDTNGHEHCWYLDGVPVKDGRYICTVKYEVPTLVFVVDGVWVNEDGEEHEYGHNECKECGEHIEPGYTADMYRQFAPGLRWFKVNGEHVSPEEFKRQYEEYHG